MSHKPAVPSRYRLTCVSAGLNIGKEKSRSSRRRTPGTEEICGADRPQRENWAIKSYPEDK